MKNRMSLPDFSPVSRSTVHEKVYDRIRDALVAGKMLPGQRIVIRDLADALGTSMMPVREALRRLEAENALIGTAGGTLTVPILTPEDYEELCLIRVALESKAAAQAATRVTPRELDKLERILVALEQASDVRDLEAALRLNREFHHLVYAAARRSLLLRLIESLWLRVGPQLSYVVRSDIYGGIAIRSDDHPHRQVLAALRSGDGRAAAAGISRDIRRAEVVIVGHLREEARKHEASQGHSGAPNAPNPASRFTADHNTAGRHKRKVASPHRVATSRPR